MPASPPPTDMETSRASPPEVTKRSPSRLNVFLLSCGVVAPLLYVATDVFLAMRWEGYSYRDQTISELNAIGAPTRTLSIVLGIVGYAFLVAFGLGVWRSAAANRRLRVAAGGLIAFGVLAWFGVPFFAMHVRGAEETLTDTLHVAQLAIAGPLLLVIIGFGAAASGWRFRLYSAATVLVMLAFGVWSGTYGADIANDLETPWVGVIERVSVFAYQLWFVVFAAALLALAYDRRHSAVRAVGFVREALALAAVVVTGVISRRPVRPLADEDRRPLPGDRQLPNAKGRWTHGITIEAPASAIWPWLVQLGCRRGGWYSYDGLDNGGLASADRIRPELQQIEVGDLMAWTPRTCDGFFVAEIEPDRALVLTGDAGLYRVAWAFVLEPIDASSTRLLARASGDYDRPAVWLLLQFVWRPLHFAMERKQLLNLRDRSERVAPAPEDAGRAFRRRGGRRGLPGASIRLPRPAKGARV